MSVVMKMRMKQPLMVMGHPDWWHNRGHKMKLKLIDRRRFTLKIEGSAAMVEIRRIIPIVASEKPGWLVSWEVIQHVAHDEVVHGKRLFSDDELAAAFGLSGNMGRYGTWVIERYGADVAEQGTYIRYRNFLNIPCPGTGHDGDPNVSVYIDEDILDAVSGFLRSKR